MRQITLAHPQNSLEKQLLNLFHSSNLPLHFNHKGNKQFTNYQRISLVVIFRRENKPIRDFIEWVAESKWISWLGLKKVPQRSTLHDWLDLFDTKLIRKLIDLSVDKLNLKVISIDGSGVDRNFKSSYYKKRLNDFGNKTKESYHKLDIVVDTYNKKQIIDYSFLLKNRHDSFVAKKLLKKIKFQKCKILADKGYPNYNFIDEMKAKQNNFISPPKNYSGKCRHNNFKRERKTRNFESNKQIYRRRVIVESVFSSLKRKQQLKLRSRLSHMKKREMGWHILFYNIRRNIIFDGKEIKENLSFFILIFEIYVTPDKADHSENFIKYIYP